MAAVMVTWCGCEKPASQPPVVHVAPVPTHPFEDGYAAGFDKGKEAAKPRQKLPAESDVATIGQDQARDDYERSDRWQHGFVSGYLDGFRKVATGKK